MLETARDIMSEKVILVEETTHINDLIRIFLEHKISSVPIVDKQKKLVGIVTKTDVLGYFLDIDLEISVKVALQDILEHKSSSKDLEVSSDSQENAGDIMTADPITADVDTPIPSLAKTMIHENIHRLIITEDSKICGVVSTIDILYYVARIDKHERK
ncbi:HPP family protein [Candidatus Omnitrophota bacterium]